MVLQLELGIKPALKYDFENYIVSDSNTQAVCHLKYLLNSPENSYIYLWGGAGVGKSHLLHAVIELAIEKNLLTSYFSFDNIDLSTTSVEILDSLEDLDIVCIDDIQCIAGHSIWEEALFGFYNRIKDANKVLIMTSDCSVNSLNITLPDLKSRLAWGVSYNLKPLNDNEKQTLLQTKAEERGMTLSDDLAKYLITRGKRDIAGLSQMLDELDLASLRHKRKLTIPFSKEVLGL